MPPVHQPRSPVVSTPLAPTNTSRRRRIDRTSTLALILLTLPSAGVVSAFGGPAGDVHSSDSILPAQALTSAPITCTAPNLTPANPVRVGYDGPTFPGIDVQKDWTYSPWRWPVISQRLRAIFVANDDGTRRVHVSPAQVAIWVDEANRIYRSSRIHIDFDPAQDWEYLNSTLLNTMTGTDHPNWNSQKALANQIAAQTPIRMVVYFRWGPDASPTGGAFSWTDYNFIVMPGFPDTYVCGSQNIGILGHESGHYLGLPHTFPAVFASIGDAQSFFSAHGNDPEAFNADGRDESPIRSSAPMPCSAIQPLLRSP